MFIDRKDAVTFDIETTGLDTAKDEAFQIGAQRFRGDEPIMPAGEWLLRPTCQMGEEAQKVHGYSLQMLEDKPYFLAVAQKVQAYLHPKLLHVVYNGLSLDVPILQRQFKDVGYVWHPDIVDAFAFVCWHLRHLPSGERKLEAIAKRMGLEVPNSHDALSDARTTASVLFRLQNDGMVPLTAADALRQSHQFSEVHRQEFTAWKWYFYARPDLSKPLSPDTVELMVGFGKHHGKPARSVVPSYFAYMLDKGNLTEAPEEVVRWFKQLAAGRQPDYQGHPAVQLVKDLVSAMAKPSQLSAPDEVPAPIAPEEAAPPSAPAEDLDTSVRIADEVEIPDTAQLEAWLALKGWRWIERYQSWRVEVNGPGKPTFKKHANVAQVSWNPRQAINKELLEALVELYDLETVDSLLKDVAATETAPARQLLRGVHGPGFLALHEVPDSWSGAVTALPTAGQFTACRMSWEASRHGAAETLPSEMPGTTRWLIEEGGPMVGAIGWELERNRDGLGIIVLTIPEEPVLDTMQLQALADKLWRAANAKLPSLETGEWAAIVKEQGDLPLQQVMTIQVEVRQHGKGSNGRWTGFVMGGHPAPGPGEQLEPQDIAAGEILQDGASGRKAIGRIASDVFQQVKTLEDDGKEVPTALRERYDRLGKLMDETHPAVIGMRRRPSAQIDVALRSAQETISAMEELSGKPDLLKQLDLSKGLIEAKSETIDGRPVVTINPSDHVRELLASSAGIQAVVSPHDRDTLKDDADVQAVLMAHPELAALIFGWRGNPKLARFGATQRHASVIDRLCSCGARVSGQTIAANLQHDDTVTCKAIVCTDEYPHIADPCPVCESTPEEFQEYLSSSRNAVHNEIIARAKLKKIHDDLGDKIRIFTDKGEEQPADLSAAYRGSAILLNELLLPEIQQRAVKYTAPGGAITTQPQEVQPGFPQLDMPIFPSGSYQEIEQTVLQAGKWMVGGEVVTVPPGRTMPLAAPPVAGIPVIVSPYVDHPTPMDLGDGPVVVTPSKEAVIEAVQAYNERQQPEQAAPAVPADDSQRDAEDAAALAASVADLTPTGTED